MTLEQAFARARVELRKVGLKRIPVLKFCKIHTTLIGKRTLLHLHDKAGKDGKIGALWMDGPNAGKLTHHRRHAERKFIKIRHKDYKADIQAAKIAETRADISKRNHSLRAAVPSLISYFEGEIHHLWEAYRCDGMMPARQRNGRDPTLGYMLGGLCDYAKREFGATVRIPRLRSWTIRDIVIHPTIQKEDPANYTKHLSAGDVEHMAIVEVESDAAAIEHFLNALWWSLKEAKKRANRQARERR